MSAHFRRLVTSAGLLLLLNCAVASQDNPKQKYREIAPDAVLWKPASPDDPAGPKMAVIAGDPSKPGMFTIRLKLPAGWTTLPHWHPNTEFTTVLSGTLLYGIGDRWDQHALHELPTGGFLEMAGGTHHFAAAPIETIVQVSGNGPSERFDVK
jgi:quercetin dioxygenase-like cupin family protein